VTERGAGAVLSIVVPVFNERDSIRPLLREVRDAVSGFQPRFEVILIDDGSTDGTWGAIRDAGPAYPELVALRLASNCGQTAALMAGIRESRGEIVVTMDGDLQNDPRDIPRLVEKLDEGYEIVSGWRRHRQDTLIGRRIPSRIANAMTRRVTGVPIHDQGCSLKAYRGRVLRSISLYSDFHRFVVPLTQMGGARVAEVETNHRARSYGRSKYGLGRTFKVMADLATLFMITRFLDRLLPWFLAFATPPFLLALAATAWTIHLALTRPDASLTVPIGSALLLYHASLSIVVSGLLAERVRLLVPRGGRPARRILASAMAPNEGVTTTLLVRDQKPFRIS
jgi:glycosyltransferase involved in cell wall biosynthesis